MTDLTLAHANTIITAAIAHARAQGYKSMAVVVVDAAGHVQAMQREDGTSMFRFDVACGKAWASVALGVRSRVLVQRAADNPNFFTALASTGQGRFIPQTGAVLIKDASGRILGAAGASGGTGDEDEAICLIGIAAAGLVAA